MDASRATIRAFGQPGDLGWVIMTHGERYAAEFGWTPEIEVLVAGIVTAFARGHDPQREAGWIAELDGCRAGCIFCVADPDDRSDAKLRTLLVDPVARGHGLGGRLTDTALDFARASGYRRIRLWTNDNLHAARRLYLARGFELTAREPHHSFGADLVGETYELELA